MDGYCAARKKARRKGGPREQRTGGLGEKKEERRAPEEGTEADQTGASRAERKKSTDITYRRREANKGALRPGDGEGQQQRSGQTSPIEASGAERETKALPPPQDRLEPQLAGKRRSAGSAAPS